MRVVLMLLLLPIDVIAQDIPKVHLLYPPDGIIFDRSFCPQFTKTEVKPEWVQETVRRRAELQALWDKEGPKYLRLHCPRLASRFPTAKCKRT
jgi:hypothetical protein